jgi:hypothetical protein
VLPENTPTVGAWHGWTWNLEYPSSIPPFVFDVPVTAKKVVLTSTMTGHGAAQPGQCGEFCTYTHAIRVNDQDYEKQYVMNGVELECELSVDDGVTPGQYGTWHFDRSSWCPGAGAEEWELDITEAVTPGESASFEWTGALFGGAPWVASEGGGSFEGVFYITIYE